MTIQTIQIVKRTHPAWRIADSLQHDDKTSRRLFRTVRALCLAAVLAIGSAAFAPPAAARSVTVATRDLDLSSIEGARTLLRRLDRAADSVCEGPVVRQYHVARRRYVACHRSTLAQAVARARAPLVSDLYASRLDEAPRVRLSADGAAKSRDRERISRQ